MIYYISLYFPIYFLDIPASKPIILTSLVGGDVNRCKLGCVWTLVGDSVDGLNLKAVLGVGLKVSDGHMSLGQPKVPGRDVHIVITPSAGPTLGQTLLTDNIVKKVISATLVTRLAPLKHQRCFIHAGDDVAWT